MNAWEHILEVFHFPREDTTSRSIALTAPGLRHVLQTVPKICNLGHFAPEILFPSVSSVPPQHDQGVLNSDSSSHSHPTNGSGTSAEQYNSTF